MARPQKQQDPYADIAQDPYADIAEGETPVSIPPSTPGYFKEILRGAGRAITGIGSFAKQTLTPHETLGATREQEVKMGPVGRLLYNVPADIGQALMTAEAARQASARSGENLPGQALSYLESSPIGGMVRKAEEAGPGYAKFEPATAGAATEAGTLYYAPRVAGAVIRTPAAVKERLQPFMRTATEVRPAVKAAVERGTKVAEHMSLAEEADRQSVTAKSQIEKVENAAWKEGNRKFDAVKEKIGADKPGEPTEDPTPIIEAVNIAQNNILRGIPESIPLFRQILKITGDESGGMAELRQQVMQGQGMKGTYADLPPEQKGLVDDIAKKYGGEVTEGQPVTWGKLQRIKSAAEKALRSRSTPPIVKQALTVVRDAAVDTMGKMVDKVDAAQGPPPSDTQLFQQALAEKGSGKGFLELDPATQSSVAQRAQELKTQAAAGSVRALWDDARKFWAEWRKDFHETSGPSGSASPVAQTLQAVDPKYIRQYLGRTQGPTANRAVEILRKYGKFGGNEAASTVEKMITTQAKAAELPKKAPGVQVAGQPKPTVDIDLVARKQIEETARRVARLNAWDFRIIAASVIGSIVAPFLGLERGVEMGSSYVAGKLALGGVLDNPKVVDWIARTPDAELQSLQQLPNIDKVNVQSALTQVAIKTKTIPSAKLQAFLGPRNVSAIFAAVGSQRPQTPAEAKQRFSVPAQ
jgi:hypothetical protein